MTGRRTITLTEREYQAITEAVCVWEAEIYEHIEEGTFFSDEAEARRTKKALDRVSAKWATAGKGKQ